MNTILYVSPFRFSASGADESLLTIVHHLSREKFRPVVALPRGSPYLKRYREAGTETHELYIGRLKRSTNPFYWLGFLFGFPLEVLSFMRLIRKTRAHLIHVNMESTIGAAIAGKLLRIPVIIHYRGNTTDRPTLFFDFFLPFLHKFSRHVFVISHGVADLFRKRGLEDHLEVLYNAVDCELLSQPFPRDYFVRHDVAWEGHPVITYLGRLHPRKRVIDFIDAAAIATGARPDIRFAIVGGNPTIPEEVAHQLFLQNAVTEKNLQGVVRFFGFEPNPADTLSSSNLLVIPSVDEGFGRVVIEAMVLGVPIVASASGAFPEILNHGQYGRLVPLYRPDLLAKAMIDSLNDPNCQEIAAAARAYARREFDIRNHVKRLELQYDRLINLSSLRRTPNRAVN